LAKALRETLISQLERNTWLHPKTRTLAIDKVTHIDIQVGSKKVELVLPLLGFDPEDYLGNFLKVGEWRHHQMIRGNKKVLQTLTQMDFTKYPAQIQNMPSFSVNALYSAQTNSIQVTTAYLQKPFLNVRQSLEYNLAYMGWTLAHEMMHALDNVGSLYDRRGKLDDWWRPEDRKRYKELQQDIQDQYETFAKDDQYFKDKDFAFTMDEDLADIGGLQVCEEYLVREKGLPALPLFYKMFAQFMRQRIERNSTRYQLIVNPHPIDKFRTNVPLSRSSLFRQIFDVKKGDGMYWHNETGIWI
jgi:predicted metalloendopeptidase